MKEIKEVQKQWWRAKEKAIINCEHRHDYEMARKLRECQMLMNDTDFEGLIDMMFSSRGIEALITYQFIDISLFRKFKNYDIEKYGVFIDCGEITLYDEKKVFLIGNTTARLKYAQTQRNRLILMYGASARVEASGYCVLNIEQDKVSRVDVTVSGHAIVI